MNLRLKEVTPSDELCKWFQHEPEKFVEFRQRYKAELHTPERQKKLEKLRQLAIQGSFTLIFAARKIVNTTTQSSCEMYWRMFISDNITKPYRVLAKTSPLPQPLCRLFGRGSRGGCHAGQADGAFEGMW